jgi:hypothetical protein
MLNFFLLIFDIHLTFSIWILAFGLGLILPEPISNLSFPYFYSLMMLGVVFFKMFQKTLYDLTSSRKDRQTNQNK